MVQAIQSTPSESYQNTITRHGYDTSGIDTQSEPTSTQLNQSIQTPSALDRSLATPTAIEAFLAQQTNLERFISADWATNDNSLDKETPQNSVITDNVDELSMKSAGLEQTKYPSDLNSQATQVKAIQKAVSSSELKQIDKAIQLIKSSEFAKTPQGRKIANKIDESRNNGLIKFGKAPPNAFAKYNSVTKIITLDTSIKGRTERIAQSLVHEAQHAVDMDENYTPFVAAMENRAHSTELRFYEELRADGYRDPDSENWRNLKQKNQLMNHLINIYGGRIRAR